MSGKPEPDVADDRYYRRERPLGAFTRTVGIGEPLDAEHTQANYTNGILRVQLARGGRGDAKKIPIQHCHQHCAKEARAWRP